MNLSGEPLQVSGGATDAHTTKQVLPNAEALSLGFASIAKYSGIA